MNYRIRQPILFAVVMGIGMAELAFALQTIYEKCTVWTIGDSTICQKILQ